MGVVHRGVRAFRGACDVDVSDIAPDFADYGVVLALENHVVVRAKRTYTVTADAVNEIADLGDTAEDVCLVFVYVLDRNGDAVLLRRRRYVLNAKVTQLLESLLRGKPSGTLRALPAPNDTVLYRPFPLSKTHAPR